MNSPFSGSSFGNEGQMLRGQPPIVGDQHVTTFFTRDTYIKAQTMGDFGERIEEGLSCLLDIQSASLEEQVLLGSGVTDGTAFRIRLHIVTQIVKTPKS